MGKKDTKFNSGWCFAIVNGRLAEIHFQKEYGIYGHCYVKREEYSKREQKMIDADVKKCRFMYRKGYYIDTLTGVKSRTPLNNIFSRDTGQFRLEQGATTRLYPLRYIEEEPTQCQAKLAVSQRVFAIFPLRFVAPRRSASSTPSSSRLAEQKNS